MMAHSATNDIHDYFQDEQGKIIKVLRHVDIKEETSLNSNDVYGGSGNGQCTDSNVYNQHPDTSSGYVRMQNNYNTPQNTTYTIVPLTSNSGRQIKQENSKTMKLNDGSKTNKYLVNNNSSSSQSQSNKTKPSTVQSSISRRRKPDKAGKGLRHFSMKVCEKVREKGQTTYNEVADELVNEEIQNQATFDSANCDQKNIRRRVYDALNVLMAMNIISKDKKEIRWIGLPTNSMQQCSSIEKENQKRRERIEEKRQQLQELLKQQVLLKSLIERNKNAEDQGFVPAANSSIQLPFIIVNTHKSTKVNCSVSTDKSEYYFKFNDKFEIHDDVEVLKRMGLGFSKNECSYEDVEKFKSMVPLNFQKYIEAYARGQDDIESEDWETHLDIHDNTEIDSRTIDQSPEHCEVEKEELMSETSDID